MAKSTLTKSPPPKAAAAVDGHVRERVEQDQTKSTQAYATAVALPPPTITGIGPVLNTSSLETKKRKTCRLHIRGTNFDTTTPASIDINDPKNEWDLDATVQDATLITVRMKFRRRKPLIVQSESGDITVTVTNGDDQAVTSPPVTVAYVNEDDLP
jgi:hypothetical protein